MQEQGSEKVVLGLERDGRSFEIRLSATDTEEGFRLGIWCGIIPRASEP
ncbi:MAG: hypothetical protein V8Q27_09370 [Eubacteriales bacterium]